MLPSRIFITLTSIFKLEGRCIWLIAKYRYVCDNEMSCRWQVQWLTQNICFRYTDRLYPSRFSICKYDVNRKNLFGWCQLEDHLQATDVQNGWTVEVWEGKLISRTFYNGCYHLSMLWLKLIHVIERGPRCFTWLKIGYWTRFPYHSLFSILMTTTPNQSLYMYWQRCMSISNLVWHLSTARSAQGGCHFADGISNYICLKIKLAFRFVQHWIMFLVFQLTIIILRFR